MRFSEIPSKLVNFGSWECLPIKSFHVYGGKLLQQFEIVLCEQGIRSNLFASDNSYTLLFLTMLIFHGIMKSYFAECCDGLNK